MSYSLASVDTSRKSDILNALKTILIEVLFEYDGQDPMSEKRTNDNPISEYGNIVIGKLVNHVNSDHVVPLYQSNGVTIVHDTVRGLYGVRPTNKNETLIRDRLFDTKLARLNFIASAVEGMYHVFGHASLCVPEDFRGYELLGKNQRNHIASILLSFLREIPIDLDSINEEDEKFDQHSLHEYSLNLGGEWKVWFVELQGGAVDVRIHDMRKKQIVITYSKRHIEDACKDSNLYGRLLTTNVDETEEEPKLHAMLALIASAYLVEMRFITEEAVCAVTTLVSSEPTES